ncbi:MAG: hypothetical protein ACRETY_03775 [Steroidobacteraceae bacterium]
MTAPDAARRSSRRRLLAVASIFIVPLAAAVLLYYSTGWRPEVNAQGTLIDPPRPLDVAGLARPDGRPAPAEIFLGRWSLVHPIGAACDERTRDILDELARVCLALDKDAGRVQPVLVHDGDCEAIAPGSHAADPLVLAAPGSAGDRFRAQFPVAVDGAAGIYIVDPQGKLMMSYPATGSARGLLKDLERLLRLSSIG